MAIMCLCESRHWSWVGHRYPAHVVELEVQLYDGYRRSAALRRRGSGGGCICITGTPSVNRISVP